LRIIVGKAQNGLISRRIILNRLRMKNTGKRLSRAGIFETKKNKSIIFRRRRRPSSLCRDGI
jgi:hypothetical protein